MEQPSIGSNNSQFRGGVQGHTGQLTICPVPDRVDKIPACFNCKYCPAGLLSWLSRWSITLNDEYTLYTEEEEEKKNTADWGLRYCIYVSRSNYIILDASARTITLVFLRMEYLQWKTQMRSKYFSLNFWAENINRWKNITADGLIRKNGTTTIWIWKHWNNFMVNNC
jgi:hypothetical protein